MRPSPTSNSDDAYLAEVLKPGGPAAHAWGERDLADMLRHQLEMRLVVELARVRQPGGGGADGRAGLAPAGGGGAKGPAPGTFGDLLSDPRPPLELLRRVKEYAKVADALPDGALPAKVATALYYAALAAALLRHGVCLTNLPPRELARGLTWLAAQPWVDDATRALCREAAGRVPVDNAIASDPPGQ